MPVLARQPKPFRPPRPPAPGSWRAPQLWPGGECFILGGGPGLNLVDPEKLRGRRLIAVNQSFKFAPFADVCFWGDCRWLDAFGGGLLDFGGLKVTTCEALARRPGIHWIRRRNAPTGLCRDPGMVCWNLSSGACAVNLAVHFGARRIVLCGFDMRKVDGHNNWHEDYSDGTKRNDPFKRFLQPWPRIADDLKERRVEVVNATPGSALTIFPIMDPKELGLAKEGNE